MTGGQKYTGRAGSVPAGLATGAIVAAVTTGMGALLLACLLNREVIAWENIGYGILSVIMLSSYLGAWVSYRRIRHQRVVVSLMSGAIYWGELLLMTALLFGGRYEAVGVTMLLVLGGCLCAAMPASGGSRGGKKKKVKWNQ